MTEPREIEEIARAIWETPLEGATAGVINHVRQWPPEFADVRDEMMRQARAAYEVMARSDGEVRSYGENCDALDGGPSPVEVLVSALERLDRNFDLLLRGKPVRDVAETKAEVRAALQHKGTAA